MTTETLSNFLAGLYGETLIEIFTTDDDCVYSGSNFTLPDGILNQFGDAEIEVFDEHGNKIEGGFVNTNLSIYIRGDNDNNQ